MTEAVTPQEAARRLDIPMPRLLWVRPSQTIIDIRVQRPVNERKRTKMNVEWQPAAFGMLSLSQRRTGKYVALDGQHRCVVAGDQGWDELVPCNVWGAEGDPPLTLVQEAALFRLLNTTNKTSAVEAYNVAVYERDPIALAIKTVLDKHRLTMTPNALRGTFAAVKAAQRIVQQHEGVLAFDWALGIITDVWGDQGEHMDGRVVEGLTLMFHRYDKIDDQQFKERLAQVKVGQHGLIGEMNTVRSVWRCSAPMAMAHVLVGVYNGKRRAGKGALEPFLA